MAGKKPRSKERKKLADDKRNRLPPEDEQETGDASDGCGEGDDDDRDADAR